MQMMGNSRPASGAEHHISHCIEMQPEGLGIYSDALHGEKVGVGTLLAVQEYHRLAQLPDHLWGDYPGLESQRIHRVFGESLGRQIFAENEADAAKGITGHQIQKNLDAIRQEIAKLPDPQTLRKTYRLLGVKSTLQDIQVPAELESRLLDESPMVRNRLTLMRLRNCLNRL
jgi:glycerol-1-phosphate dehydrogenase [NAD(P)+]